MKHDRQDRGSLHRLADYGWKNWETVLAAGVLVAVGGLFAKFYRIEQEDREGVVPVQVSPLEGLAEESTSAPVSSVEYSLERASGGGYKR